MIGGYLSSYELEVGLSERFDFERPQTACKDISPLDRDTIMERFKSKHHDFLDHEARLGLLEEAPH